MSSNLKNAMDRRKMSIQNLNHKEGVDYSFACRIFKGYHPVSAEYAIRFEKALGIPRWELRPDLWEPPTIKDGAINK